MLAPASGALRFFGPGIRGGIRLFSMGLFHCEADRILLSGAAGLMRAGFEGVRMVVGLLVDLLSFRLLSLHAYKRSIR